MVSPATGGVSEPGYRSSASLEECSRNGGSGTLPQALCAEAERPSTISLDVLLSIQKNGVTLSLRSSLAIRRSLLAVQQIAMNESVRLIREIKNFQKEFAGLQR